jgi:metallo-beta-lactamase class B
MVALSISARLNAIPAEWTTPFPAFHIAGNLYYVGSKELAAYLIVTPKGNILINSDMEANVPLIRQGIESLGFRFSDTKILLISHAHYDHCGGSAEIKRLTGARYMVMDADVPVVEAGGGNDFHFSGDPSMYFTPTKVDKVLRDGETVRLGPWTKRNLVHLELKELKDVVCCMWSLLAAPASIPATSWSGTGPIRRLRPTTSIHSMC